MFSNSEALSRASHELRTPLNAILGFGQLLELDELNESQRHSVEQIMAGGRHLLALIEDLLDLSRLDASGLELRPVDVGAQIAEAVSLCAPLSTERSLTLTVDSSDEPKWALADPRRLKQVLLNLVSNAVKYNRPGGSITIRAERDGDDGVRVDVIDSGIRHELPPAHPSVPAVRATRCAGAGHRRQRARPGRLEGARRGDARHDRRRVESGRRIRVQRAPARHRGALERRGHERSAPRAA